MRDETFPPCADVGRDKGSQIQSLQEVSDDGVRPEEMGLEGGVPLTSMHTIYIILLVMQPPSQALALKKLHSRRQKLLAPLLNSDPLLIGTLCDVYRRCGNPYCHCSKKASHLQTLLLYPDKQGKRRCRFVRQQDAEKLRKLWMRYRECRKALCEIQTLNQQELRLLRVQIHKRGFQFSVRDNSEKD